MKPIFYILIFFLFQFKLYGQLLFSEDFENYTQGPISSQNSLWSDLSNATANIFTDGGAYMACGSQDPYETYLNFVSGDFIAVSRSMSTTGTQILFETKILALDGFFIQFYGNDNNFFTYVNNSYNDNEVYLQFSMNFFYNQMQVFENGQFLGIYDIPDFITNLESVTLANEAGDF
ncbi:MAG: hypothetical protein RLZZ546_2900, partial [Bacteroidota bacterium]